MNTLLNKKAANNMLKKGNLPKEIIRNGKKFRGYGRFVENFLDFSGFEFPLPEQGHWIFKEENVHTIIRTSGFENHFHGSFESLFESNLPMICHLDKEYVYQKVINNGKYILIDEELNAEVTVSLD